RSKILSTKHAAVHRRTERVTGLF
ncbi:MAG: hypothetical protein QOI79_2738, partial [Mycobacterium sp.]|nr:hypothetical protein [Mycobacterium sp.]